MDVSRRLDPGATREEFDRFVVETAASLLRAVYLVVWDEQEAEDLLQECYARLARRWPRVRRMDSPRAYARKVLVNLALDERRQQRRRRDELSHGGSVDSDRHQDHVAAAAYNRIDLGTDLDRALEELAPRQRAALVLRYFEDLSEAQTAEAMGCSVGTVKSTTARALERLRLVTGDPPDRTSDPTPDPTWDRTSDPTSAGSVGPHAAGTCLDGRARPRTNHLPYPAPERSTFP